MGDRISQLLRKLFAEDFLDGERDNDVASLTKETVNLCHRI